MKGKRVFIVGSDYSSNYKKMWENRGVQAVPLMEQSDFLQFTGGADVSPDYYNQPLHPRSSCTPARDVREALIYSRAVKLEIPMAGICRGAQFLNVMNGGTMWQHVDNHSIHGTHKATNLITGEDVMVTSTHHQMMRPDDIKIDKGDCQIILVADLSETKEKMFWRQVTPGKAGGHPIKTAAVMRKVTGIRSEPEFVNPIRSSTRDRDIECVMYHSTKCLCFQPHPELPGYDDLADYYVTMVQEYLFQNN